MQVGGVQVVSLLMSRSFDYVVNAAVQLVVAISPQARNAKKTSINVHTLLIYSCTFLWRRTGKHPSSIINYLWVVVRIFIAPLILV